MLVCYSSCHSTHADLMNHRLMISRTHCWHLPPCPWLLVLHAWQLADNARTTCPSPPHPPTQPQLHDLIWLQVGLHGGHRGGRTNTATAGAAGWTLVACDQQICLLSAAETYAYTNDTAHAAGMSRCMYCKVTHLMPQAPAPHPHHQVTRGEAPPALVCPVPAAAAAPPAADLNAVLLSCPWHLCHCGCRKQGSALKAQQGTKT
jgi:hypothetical protein